MNRSHRLAVTAAIAATMLTATPVLAVRHVEAGAECGTITVYNATDNWGVWLYSSTFDQPTRHFVFTRDGTITYNIAPGGYSYQFHAPAGQSRRSGTVLVGC